MRHRLCHSLRNATFWLALLVFTAAHAAEFDSENQAGRVSLITALESVDTASILQAGIAFDLKPGWKIYWRVPGDAGYPPKIAWDKSTNIDTPTLSWPAPKRTIDAGLQTIGYTGSVILPVSIPLHTAGQAVHLQADLDYLACEKICVPLEATLTLDLPAGPATPTIHMHRLAQAIAALPVPAPSLGWHLDSAELNGTTLVVSISADQPFVHPDVFVEDDQSTAFSPPRVQNEGKHITLTYANAPTEILGKSVRLTAVDGAKAGEFQTTITPGTARPNTSLFLMVGVALLGGLILNLMPCVLPILSLKLLALLAHSGGHRLHARAAFLASTAGILVSFLGLATILILIRSAGHAIGWGLQFQQPVFLGLMIAILIAFSANLWGLFEIPLPAWAGELGTGGNSLAGHFMSGFFATLLATPCSAPFVGTAISFALSRGAQDIFVIFLALGTGMSLPFLSVALWPELATKLPHPGPWMGLVRRILGVSLATTAAWLVVVLVGVLGHTTQSKSTTIAWIPFDRAAIAQHVAQGHVVFVDVTADWCISCKVNKLTVIERGEVASALSSPGTIAMQADWTKPDEEIARYLESAGRFGIPFDAVYGPGTPDGIALPELPTTLDVLTALHAAKP